MRSTMWPTPGDDAADAVDDLADTRRDVDKVTDAVDAMADEADDAEKAFGDLARGARADMGKVGNAADNAERDVDELTDEEAHVPSSLGLAFGGDPEALEEVQGLTSELGIPIHPGHWWRRARSDGGLVFSALIGFYERWKEEQGGDQRTGARVPRPGT